MNFVDVASFGLQTTRDPGGEVRGAPSTEMLIIMPGITELVIIIDLGKDSDVNR